MDEKPIFGTNDFSENPEPRVPCVLLLDTSGSMAGQPIGELNDALIALKDSLAADALAAKRVEIAIVTFGGSVQTATDFTTAAAFHPPTLVAGGQTPMGAAIVRGLEMVNNRKVEYKSNGIAYYRPWVFMITDGGPTDSYTQAKAEIAKGTESKAHLFLAVAVQGANTKVLEEITPGGVRELKGLQFRDLFLWLSASMKSVSQSNPGQAVALPSTDKWAVV